LTEFIRQLPALIGVILGALTTYLATSLSERSRWRREKYVRWDERRVTAYAEYADSLKRQAYAFLRVAATNSLNVNAQPFPDQVDQDQSLREIEVERSTRWEKVLLLGDKTVIYSAQEYTETIFTLGAIAKTKVIDESKWLRAVQEMSTARGSFYNAIRHDLEIKSGSLERDPMLSWIPEPMRAAQVSEIRQARADHDPRST
jgi:hypothetical protein